MATPSEWTLKLAGSAIDADAKSVTLLQLAADSRTSQRLTFRENQLHFDNSWDEGDACILEYPTGTVVFSGRIVETRRDGAREEGIIYTAQDWRALSRNVQITRRGPDNLAGEDLFPERIYNAPADDPDSKYNALVSATSTVGQILTDLFDDFDTYLVAEGAVSATTPYSAADLTGLSHVPGKVVLSGLTFEQAVMTVLVEQGRAYATWVDKDGQWRFWDTRNAPSSASVTIASDDVESVDLRRHIQGRYTAVQLHGDPGKGEDVVPHRVGFGDDENGNTMSGVTKDWTPGDEATWNRLLGSGYNDTGIISGSAGSDRTISGKGWATNQWQNGYAIFPRYSWTEKFTISANTSDTVTVTSPPSSGAAIGDPIWLQSETGGMMDVFRLFQITDSTKREIVQDSSGDIDCCPHIVGILKNSGGTITGKDIIRVRLESDGRFRSEIPLISSPTNGYGVGDSTLFPDWYFSYCYRDATTASTFLARYPTTPATYAGEASGAPWSISRELQIFVPEFDDLGDLATFQSVAEEIHKVVSAVGTSGSIRLAGIDWSYLDPRQQIHLAHASDTTGWEALGASLTGATFDFPQQATTLAISDSGDSTGVDYQQLVNQILAKRKTAEAQAEAEKMGNFVNCETQSFGQTRDTSRVVGAAEGAGGSEATATLTTPNFQFPRPWLASDPSQRTVPEKAVRSCECDNLSVGVGGGKIPCQPDDKDSMSVKHSAQSGVGPISQLIWRDIGSITCRPYYPIACDGVAIDPDDTNCPDGANFDDIDCATGMRSLVSLEPDGIDNGSTGSEISVAQLLLLHIRAMDNYMQHNEEAHCCLDNRIACVDKHVWGGAICHGDVPGKDCKVNIASAITDLCGMVNGLRDCINNIFYEPGESHVNCGVRCLPFDFRNCGPC